MVSPPRSLCASYGMAKSKTEREPIYYWDACVYISWLDGGQGRTTSEMSDLQSVASGVQNNKAILVTSEITRVEVVKLNASAQAQFDAFLMRPNSRPHTVDKPVIDRATKLRTAIPSLKTPDSIHLATAMKFGVDSFHTFDGKLLALSGSPNVNRMTIEKPATSQMSIPLSTPLARSTDGQAEEAEDQ